MTTRRHRPPEITAELRPLRGTILLDLLHVVTTMTTGSAAPRQPDTTQGPTTQTLMVQPLTRRVGTILSRLIVMSTIAGGLPLRGTHLTLPPAVVAAVLHQPVVGMTLTAHLPGKIPLCSTTLSFNSSTGITLPVPYPLDLMIILPPERIPPMDHQTLAIGMLTPWISGSLLTPSCRRRSQSPPPRSSSSAFEPVYQGGTGGPPYTGGGPPAGYTGGNGYSGNNPPPRSAGGTRDYPPRASRDNAEPPPGYRRL